MAQKNQSATSTSSKKKLAFDSISDKNARLYRDVSRTDNVRINTYSKEDLMTYLSAIGSSEVNLRNLSRYLF